MELHTQPVQLTHFLALLERRSFRLAAEHLGISQSALTKSLQRLEARLGMRLFDRTTRSVVPTPMALELRALAQAALLGMDRFEDQARVVRTGQAGLVRLAAVAVAEPLAARALAALSGSHPGLEVELAVGGPDVYADLEAGRCDLVVGDEVNAARSSYAAALRVTPLGVEPLVMLFHGTHPLANHQRPSLADAMAYPWAIPSRYFADNRALQHLAEYAREPGFPRYRLSSVAACVEVVAASDVIGLVPGTIAQRCEGQGFRWSALEPPVNVALAAFTLARAAPTPAVQIVRESLVLAAQENSSVAGQRSALGIAGAEPSAPGVR